MSLLSPRMAAGKSKSPGMSTAGMPAAGMPRAPATPPMPQVTPQPQPQGQQAPKPPYMPAGQIGPIGVSSGPKATGPAASTGGLPPGGPSTYGFPTPTQTFPGGSTGTPNTGGGAQTPQSSNLDDLNKLYQDILGQHDSAWADQQKMLEAQMGAGQRRADALNASMGRSIGGGYAGLQAQAQLSGMNQMSQAKLASDEQRRGLQLSWLDKQLDEKHRQEERGWQQADNADQDRMDTIQMMLGAMGDDVSPEVMQAIMAGDWDAAESLLKGDASDMAGQAAIDKRHDRQNAYAQNSNLYDALFLPGSGKGHMTRRNH